MNKLQCPCDVMWIERLWVVQPSVQFLSVVLGMTTHVRCCGRPNRRCLSTMWANFEVVLRGGRIMLKTGERDAI